MPRPPCRSPNRSFVSPADKTPAVPLAESLLSFFFDALPAAPLAEWLVSFSFRRLARRATRCINRLFLLTPRCPSRCLLIRSFLSPADETPAAPLAASLVSFSRRRHASGATRCIARFFVWLTPCLRRRSVYRSFVAPVNFRPAAESCQFRVGIEKGYPKVSRR
jgi:hypothetical protein